MRRRLTLILALVAIVAAGGCSRKFRHTWPDGSVSEYENRGFNTSFQDLELINGEFRLKISKFSSEAKAFEVAAEAVKRIPVQP